MDTFTLARQMGTSVEMIDRHYGHLRHDSHDAIRYLHHTFDARNGRRMDAGEAA
jgi:hypothetical protein